MSYIFNEFLYHPLFNLLVFLYNTASFGDIGLAIVLMTILIRLVLWPLSQKAIQSQKSLQDLQPKIKAVQEKFKDNKEEQSKALMALYKENKVNPFSGCLPILIQLPIMIALYRVFLKGFDVGSLSMLYPFIKNPGLINPISMGLISLALPSKILAVLAGVFQFWQAKIMMPKKNIPEAPKKSDEFMAQAISKQTLYFLPILTVIISWKLPAGLALYWTITTLFTVLQQYVMLGNGKK